MIKKKNKNIDIGRLFYGGLKGLKEEKKKVNIEIIKLMLIYI